MSVLRRPFRYVYIKATFIIIAINVLVFLACNYTPLRELGLQFFYGDRPLAVLPYMDFKFGLNFMGFVERHWLWQPITYMFMHGNWQHLLCNMIGLFFFGSMVERALGSKEFVLLYILTGVLSGLFSVLMFYFFGNSFTVLIGASGAVYAILLTYAVIFPQSRIFIWGLIPVPAPLLVIIYAAIEFFSQFGPSDGIGHVTHLAGFGFAWLYLVLRMGINPFRVWFRR